MLVAAAGQGRFCKISEILTVKQQRCNAIVKPECLWENHYWKGSTTRIV